MSGIQEIQAEIVEDFAMFDDWIQKYEYMIDLGKELWIEWSKKDNEGYDSEGIEKNWINWKKKAKKKLRNSAYMSLYIKN